MDFLERNILFHGLWLFPALLLLIWAAARIRAKRVRLCLGERGMSAKGCSTLSVSKRILRNTLLIAAFAFLLLAAARPHWGKKLLPISSRGRDVIFVVDVSKSMLSRDIKPSRLDHAKWILRKIIEESPGDRFGVLAFAGAAFMECPLTPDRTSLFSIIDALDTESIPVGGTNIENALEKAYEAFEGAEGAHRGIVLLTDGDQLEGDAAKAAKSLKEKSVSLVIVGIGDPSSPGLVVITGKDGQESFLRDGEGKLVKSPLNEKSLRDLAVQVDGLYVRSTSVGPGLGLVLEGISDIMPKKYSSGNRTRPIERFPIPLFLGIVLLFVRLGLNERRAAAALAVFIICVSLSLGAEEPGTEMTDDKGPEPAEKTFEGLEAFEIYNRGVSSQNKKEDGKAASAYKTVLNDPEPEPPLKAKAYQNFGVIIHEKARKEIQTQPEQALETLNYAEDMYRESMRLAANPEIAANQQALIADREKAREIIEEREKLRQQLSKAKKDIGKAREENRKQEKGESSTEKTRDSIRNAEKSLDELKKEAEKQKRADIDKKAQEAGEELAKAGDQNMKGRPEKTDEHLRKALEKLGSPADKQEKSDKDKKGQPEKRDDIDKQEKDEGKGEKFDPDQAESLLRDIAENEKLLRKALKQRRNRARKNRMPDKDW